MQTLVHLVHIAQQHEDTHAARPLQPTATDARTLPAIPRAPAGVEKKLTPYEAAAKAIFVKANGLAAYYKTTGLVGCAD